MNLYKFVCIPPAWDDDPAKILILRGLGTTPWKAWRSIAENPVTLKELRRISRRPLETAADVLDWFPVLAVFQTGGENLWWEFDDERQRSEKQTAD